MVGRWARASLGKGPGSHNKKPRHIQKKKKSRSIKDYLTEILYQRHSLDKHRFHLENLLFLSQQWLSEIILRRLSGLSEEEMDSFIHSVLYKQPNKYFFYCNSREPLQKQWFDYLWAHHPFIHLKKISGIVEGHSSETFIKKQSYPNQLNCRTETSLVNNSGQIF